MLAVAGGCWRLLAVDGGCVVVVPNGMWVPVAGVVAVPQCAVRS